MTDETTRLSRRQALATTGVTLVSALAGCTGGGSGEHTSTGTPTHTATSTATATETPTATPAASLDEQLRRVRQATAQYEDPKQALADGFKPGGPYVPGMGWHFQNKAWLGQAAKNGFTLEKPPILTYLETDSGLQLGAVEYGAPATAVPENSDLFNDDAADATETWHSHKAATHVFAVPDGKTTSLKDLALSDWTKRGRWTEFRPPDRDLERGDTVSLNWGTPHGKEGERTERIADFVTTHPDLATLHAWVHTENPDGVFAPVNPNFTDGEGGHSH
ncbi:MAG: hypothetical protein ABEH78_09545 [Haloferacaceae archaeon]